ncbi:hypothetical protein AAKU55_001415 [Oxalobacteraceae bacterium GrIS 1.11]
MKLTNIVHQATALIVAFGLLLSLPMVLDYAFDTSIETCVIVWVNVGMFTMRAKNIVFPMPAPHYIDVGGGLRLLWWAIYWPAYLRG